MFNAFSFSVILAAGLTASAPAQTQNPAPAPPAASPNVLPNDYNDPKAWLCRPGGKDACDVDLAATVVAANGRLTKETFKADPNAPIDCFYVYPTISTDPSENSDMTADPAELNVIAQQFARFASRCRVYAPLYRQVTLVGLRKRLAAGGARNLDRGLAYDDVRDAWNHYLQNDNQGRGVVLVGHSQGAYILTALIANEIDGKPVQSRLVSAFLLGANVPVMKGKDVGGVFKHVPLCRSASQTGCVVTYMSFRSTIPPPANTLFGIATGTDLAAGCTNPAALAGGPGELHSYLSTAGRTITSTAKPKPWVDPEQPIETPFVSVPGLLTAKCTTNEHASYLEITVNGNSSDPRVDDITGDLGTPPNVLAQWGLHLIDVNLGMGNLLDLVGAQTAAYLKKK